MRAPNGRSGGQDDKRERVRDGGVCGKAHNVVGFSYC